MILWGGGGAQGGTGGGECPLPPSLYVKKGPESYLFYISWLAVYVYVDFGTHETNKLW